MLITHRSNRLEALADALAEVLAVPGDDPVAPETVVVPNHGVARWLAIGLADRLGVCANVRFPFPAEFVWDSFRAVLGADLDSAPFEPPVLTWRVLEQLESPGGEAVPEALKPYLDGADALGRFALAGRLAALLDQYLVYRPDWILRWEAGEADHWQARLWRRLAAAGDAAHWVRVREDFAAALGSGAGGPRLRRAAVFGMPALSPGYLDVLCGLAGRVDVHLFVLDPCREHWGEIVAPRGVERRAAGADPQALHLEAGNALLASLGQQGRDLIDAVTERAGVDHERFVEPEPGTLLARIQRDLLCLVEPGRDGASPPPVAPGDESLQIHACHGPMREVEVLHDRLLALFESDPDLGPSDVVVMTPDIERYAPSVRAVFGSAPAGQRIPFRIADLGAASESGLIGAFFALLDLAASRYEAERVAALLETPAVQRRFRIDDAALARLRGWIRECGIRWGVDAASRAELDLPPTEEHTWRRGLDRLVLGYAWPGEGTAVLGGVLPFDEVEGADAELIGRLLAFSDAAFALRERLAGVRPAAAWTGRLHEVLESFFLPEPAEEDWIGAVRRGIDELGRRTARAGYTGALPLAVVRAFLAETIAPPRPAASFLGGGVTFCALTPMRGIPFEIVCLLGMDDGAFPRAHRPPAFDLMRDDARRGDRTRRDDDRYLFLETLLAARRRLYISHVGRGARDDRPLPPSVLVSELLDYAAQGLDADAARALHERLVTDHPLQPFAERNFTGESRVFSHSELFAAGARAGAGPRAEVSPLVSRTLDPPAPRPGRPAIPVEEFVRFFRSPVRHLLRDRLGIRLDAREGVLEGSEPFEVGGFARTDLRAELVGHALGGMSDAEIAVIARAGGRLPHGAPGAGLLREESARARRFAARLQALGPPGRGAVAIDLDLGPLRVAGTLDGLGEAGLVGWRVAKLAPGDRLAAWIRHLLLCAAGPPGYPARSAWIAEDESLVLDAVAAPAGPLATLAERYLAGQRVPLHFFPRSSWAYAESLAAGRDAWTAARRKWRATDRAYGDEQDPWVGLAFRGSVPLDDAFAAEADAICTPLLRHLGAAR